LARVALDQLSYIMGKKQDEWQQVVFDSQKDRFSKILWYLEAESSVRDDADWPTLHEYEHKVKAKKMDDKPKFKDVNQGEKTIERYSKVYASVVMGTQSTLKIFAEKVQTMRELLLKIMPSPRFMIAGDESKRMHLQSVIKVAREADSQLQELMENVYGFDSKMVQFPVRRIAGKMQKEATTDMFQHHVLMKIISTKIEHSAVFREANEILSQMKQSLVAWLRKVVSKIHSQIKEETLQLKKEVKSTAEHVHVDPLVVKPPPQLDDVNIFCNPQLNVKSSLSMIGAAIKALQSLSYNCNEAADESWKKYFDEKTLRKTPENLRLLTFYENIFGADRLDAVMLNMIKIFSGASKLLSDPLKDFVGGAFGGADTFAKVNDKIAYAFNAKSPSSD